MRRTALYLGGLVLATGATLAMAGPAMAADAGCKKFGYAPVGYATGYGYGGYGGYGIPVGGYGVGYAPVGYYGGGYDYDDDSQNASINQGIGYGGLIGNAAINVLSR